MERDGWGQLPVTSRLKLSRETHCNLAVPPRSAMQSGSLWPSRPTCKRPAWSVDSSDSDKSPTAARETEGAPATTAPLAASATATTTPPRETAPKAQARCGKIMAHGAMCCCETCLPAPLTGPSTAHVRTLLTAEEAQQAYVSRFVAEGQVQSALLTAALEPADSLTVPAHAGGAGGDGHDQDARAEGQVQSALLTAALEPADSLTVPAHAGGAGGDGHDQDARGEAGGAGGEAASTRVLVQSQAATSEEQLFDNMVTAGGPQPTQAPVTVIGFTSFSQLLPYIEALEARRAQEAAQRARQAASPDPDDSQGGVVPGSFHTWTPRSDPGDLASDGSQPEPASKATRVD